ncbi:MAG: Gfo/Idh/MocA family oxidoreductase [Candidatus Omnitrophica bacterium]|nr:Gfo/Idh/MocA family oxidoreductase [Candidatus Omnitrophota bacterium]
MNMGIGVGIVGAGNIGRKRAEALSKFRDCRLVAVADANVQAARYLGGQHGAAAERDWQRLVLRHDIDIVIVSTINKFLFPVCLAALKNRKHVLCEKPLGRNSREARLLVAAAGKSGVVLKTGFNHRYHPAVVKAKALSDRGEIGKIHLLRCRYGHGGRPGYEKEWRASKVLCGGGELLDQGVHVVDLFRWFAGDFDAVSGQIATLFWDMKVEDNALAVFKKKGPVLASLQTSWSQWKNLFSFEIFGDRGYLVIDGLGGSYGVETLTVGKRKLQGGVPSEKIFRFPGPDISWEREWKDLVSAVRRGTKVSGSGWDGYQANKMLEAVYRSAEKRKEIRF